MLTSHQTRCRLCPLGDFPLPVTQNAATLAQRKDFFFLHSEEWRVGSSQRRLASCQTGPRGRGRFRPSVFTLTRVSSGPPRLPGPRGVESWSGDTTYRHGAWQLGRVASWLPDKALEYNCFGSELGWIQTPEPALCFAYQRCHGIDKCRLLSKKKKKISGHLARD